MWFSPELLARARMEQRLANRAPRPPPLTPSEYEARQAATMSALYALAAQPSLPRLVEEIRRFTPVLRTILEDEAPRYLTQQVAERSVRDLALEELYVQFREALHALVFHISENNVTVDVTDTEPVRALEDELRRLSDLVQDAGIAISIEMDCSRDWEIAQQLSRMVPPRNVE